MDHFAVTACFLGFNLKKRPMASNVEYVAKTHYREEEKQLRMGIACQVSS